MKVLFAVIGGAIGAVAAVFFFANLGADWYTSRSEFQSPTEYEETYGTIYLLVIGGCLVLGYIIGRVIGGRFDRRSSGVDTSFS